MWKLNAIRFAAFAVIALAASAINSATHPHPAEPVAVEMAALPDCPKCETSMESLQAKNRWTASGQYIGAGPVKAAAVKAKHHKTKLHHKMKHTSKLKKPVHHSIRHRRINHPRASQRHVFAHHKAHKAKVGGLPVRVRDQVSDLHAGQATRPAASAITGSRAVTSKSMPMATKIERCTPDAIRLCASAIPHRDKIIACMKANHAQLSKKCAPVFSAHDATPFHRRS
jgi:hypothetical protein